MSNLIYVVNPGEDENIVTNVQTAVTAAVDGDVIVMPSGTFKWDGRISTTKSVSLWGSTTGDATTVYVPETVSDATLDAREYMFQWDFTARPETLDSGIVVKAIIFKSKYPSFSPLDGGSVAVDMALKFIFVNGFVVRDCQFHYFGEAGVEVTHRDDYASGLVAYNYFNQCKGYDGLGLGYGVVVYGEYTTWVSSPQFGSSNFIFIENNKFNELRHSIAANGGSLYVARYNYILNSIVGNTSALDGHIPGDGPTGSRATEVYNNTIENTNFMIRIWANSAARAAAVPFNASADYGIQEDTGVLYVSNGASAGNWTAATLPKGNHIGYVVVPGKEVTAIGEGAIRIEGGESVIHDNTVINWRFAVGVSDGGSGYSGAYPVPYGAGWASGVALGPGHSGVNLPQANGDMFEWNQTFTPYVFSGPGSSQKFYNYTPAYFVSDRDYHTDTAKPLYTPYTYPHPYIYR